MGKKVIKKKEAVKKAKPKAAPAKKDKKSTAVKKVAQVKKAAPKSKLTPKKAAPAKKVVAKKAAPVKKEKVVAKVKNVKTAPKTSKITTTPKVKVVKEVKAKVEVSKPIKSIPVPSPVVEKVKAAKGRPKKEKSADTTPKPEVKKRPVVVKQLAKPLGNIRKSEIVVPRISKPIQIDPKDKMNLKKQLLTKCLDLQTHVISTAKNAMNEAQQSANEEKNNEEMADSFRETMHATRDVYARQVQEGVNTLGLLNRIIIKPIEVVKFGSVVITDFQNYFISAGLGEVKIDDKVFVTVSTLTPLFQILSDKKKGDLFMFLDRKYRILDVF